MIPGYVAWCPRQDSNLRPCLRRAVLYPLSYGGRSASATNARWPFGPSQSLSADCFWLDQRLGQDGGGSGLAPRSRSNCSISKISPL